MRARTGYEIAISHGQGGERKNKRQGASEKDVYNAVARRSVHNDAIGAGSKLHLHLREERGVFQSQTV